MASSAVPFIAILALYHVSAMDNIKAFDSTITIPEECRPILGNEENGNDLKNYCNLEPKNYPDVLIDKYLESLDFPTHQEEVYDEVEDCGVGVESERERNCCTITKWETPFVVKSESMLKLVIQSKYFQQKIKTVTCADQGKKCFKDFNFETWGYRTECQPNWSFTKLCVYNSETNQVEWVPFNFPVSCSCNIRSV